MILYPPDKFVGACIDSGAKKSFIRCEQARAYCSSMNLELSLSPSPLRFKFGSSTHKSEGTMEIRVPVFDGVHIRVDTDVVRADVSLLIRLEMVVPHQLILDFAKKSYTKRDRIGESRCLT